ncbi:nucleotide exchange factor GrpE [Planotetraspora thailandica]|nr:nucleotide exchange factor GrpE [Planotetraspora thailandica]
MSDSRRKGRRRTDLPRLPQGTGEKAVLAGAPPPTREPLASPPHAHAGRPSARSTRELEAELAERTADVQRVKAEYDNYRKRVQRDRLAVREAALANVLRGLLPVLDAIARARELGEVRGGFQLVAEALEDELSALGLESFGEPGEGFDPTLHEALIHAHSTEVDRPTCSEILAAGYRIGDRLLRPAYVRVIEPPTPAGGR